MAASYKGVGAVAVASGVTADGASTIKQPPDYASEFVLRQQDDAHLPCQGGDALHAYFRACRRANGASSS